MEKIIKRLERCAKRYYDLYAKTASSAHAVLAMTNRGVGITPFDLFLLGESYNIDGPMHHFKTINDMEAWIVKHEREREILFRKF